MVFFSIKEILLIVGIVFLNMVIPRKIRWFVLLCSNFAFYFLVSQKKWSIVCLIISVVMVYFSARIVSKIDKKRKKKNVFILCLGINLSILFVLYYVNFFIDCLDKITKMAGTSSVGKINIIIPIGLMAYTMQSVGYLFDVYYEKYEAERNILKIALFLSYIPCITQGVIGRYDKLKDQLFEGKKFDYKRVKQGITLFLYGLFKDLVIAKRILIYVNSVFNNYQKSGGKALFIAIILNTLYVYISFSSCLDMIRGLYRTMGIEVDKNFDAPFFSRSVREFFTRWFITVREWMRDYVYYPLSSLKNKTKSANTNANEVDNKVLPLGICVLIGLWYGNTAQFAFLSILFYCIMKLGQIISKKMDKVLNAVNSNRKNKVLTMFQIIRTNIIVSFGMLVYKVGSLKKALTIIYRMIAQKGEDIYLSSRLKKPDFLVIIVAVLLLIGYEIWRKKLNQNSDKTVMANKDKKSVYAILIDDRCLLIKYLVYYVLIMAIIMLGVYWNMSN